MRQESCLKCYYGESTSQLHGPPVIHCKRYPPQIIIGVINNQPQPMAVELSRKADDWCGEFKTGIKIETELPKENGKILRLT